MKECKFAPDTSKTKGKNAENRTLKEFLDGQRKHER